MVAAQVGVQAAALVATLVGVQVATLGAVQVVTLAAAPGAVRVVARVVARAAVQAVALVGAMVVGVMVGTGVVTVAARAAALVGVMAVAQGAVRVLILAEVRGTETGNVKALIAMTITAHLYRVSLDLVAMVLQSNQSSMKRNIRMVHRAFGNPRWMKSSQLVFLDSSAI